MISEGGFEKAARSLHLTQGAVSQRVKLLEEQTGCVLLVRSSPPSPTAAGREMLKHFRKVKQLEEDLGPGLGQENKGFTTLPVGINADSLATWFSRPSTTIWRITLSCLICARTIRPQPLNCFVTGTYSAASATGTHRSRGAAWNTLEIWIIGCTALRHTKRNGTMISLQ